MAFTKQPQVSTYQTKQISLVTEMNSRGSVPTVDANYFNCYPEFIKNKVTQQQETSLRRRPGTTPYIPLPFTTVRGWYYWEDQNKIYIAQNDDVYVYSATTSSLLATLNNVFPTTVSGDVGFSEFLYDDGTVKIVVTDGTTLSTIDSANVVVASADPDLPVHVPEIVYLDGYIFLIKVNTADLYNSNLNDPLAYTAGDFISSEILPDQVLTVRKMNNYILLFGSDSVEYFWDAANETGSPLQRNDTPVKFTGLVGGIAQLGNKIYFVGDADQSQVSVFVLEDFKITPVGNEMIRRWLTANSNDVITANIVSVDGHDFYILYAGEYTYALELETNFWHRWGWQDDASFPMMFAINCRTTTSYGTIFVLEGIGEVYKFNDSIFQDDSQPITVSWTSNNEMFDTWDRKTMSSLTIWADKPTSSGPLLVQWSDDDYQTFNAGVTVDLFQDCPRIYRLGMFRRRAFKFTHTANGPLRVHKIEATINMGNA